jgi:hypothetical protein
MDLALKGKVPLEGIDDFVDRWRESSAEVELPSFLGMTESEYALWLNRTCLPISSGLVTSTCLWNPS